jgi:hypothetical protein
MLNPVLFKIYSKKYSLKNYSNMFRITQDSRTILLYSPYT